MNTVLLNLLRCSDCNAKFNVSAEKENENGLDYGVLSCHCGAYPVVAGIPILKKNNLSVIHSADAVIALIQDRRYDEALLAMLMPPLPDRASFAPSWMRSWSIRGMGRVKTLLGSPGVRKWKSQVAAVLNTPKYKLSVMDFLDLYYQSSIGPSSHHQSANYNYFAFRLSQPRYLVALSLASLVRQGDGVVLDLACGFGNVTRYLARATKGPMVVGMDENFYSLHCAKNWLAPDAQYVCGLADSSLPFSDRSCSLTYASDAFHLFVHQATAIRELKRVTTQEGTLVLSSVPNGSLKPRFVKKSIIPRLPPAGYAALLADMPHRFVNNHEILERYLQKNGPALSLPEKRDHLDRSQWISVVASHRPEVFVDHAPFEDWPHVEADRLGLNPLYKPGESDALGNVYLKREFPSTWYAQEDNSEDGQYVPEKALLSPSVMTDLLQGNRSSDIERLIEQGVVIGIPDRYFTPQTT